MKKGSAFNFACGTTYKQVAEKLNAHYADKLSSQAGWYGTAAVNIAGDAEKNIAPQSLRYARTARGWDVYQLAGVIADSVTVESGEFVPVTKPE